MKLVRKPEFQKEAFRRASWSSLSRLIGVGLGAGAGSILHELVGGGVSGWSVAFVMAGISFVLMLYAEYERERK